MTALGITWTAEEINRVSLERSTRESKTLVTVEDAPRRDYKIDTGIAFFNHMLETIAWNACLNIDAVYENTQYRLTHVITEDIGITLGLAFAKLIEKRMEGGINSSGSGINGIDEALAIANVSFEGRAMTSLDYSKAEGASVLCVDDALSADIAEFFYGFAQGAGATVNIQVLSGRNPHHTWESVYRSFGTALKNSLSSNVWKAGTTAGVKGTLL
ncbi:hypothetical protein KJ652_04330 [Patescibacteria group bacterium]|nr:hypothetical protein [Patescibacteria group bacterium]MBU1123794.1 hypothetical protein [Patescibacteria group bacterium]MBU1911093.1 hypothetical protein [Patescibacteria group bacterium]